MSMENGRVGKHLGSRLVHSVSQDNRTSNQRPGSCRRPVAGCRPQRRRQLAAGQAPGCDRRIDVDLRTADRHRCRRHRDADGGRPRCAPDSGAPEGAGLTQTDPDHGQADILQGGDQKHFQTAGRFHHDAIRCQSGLAVTESLEALLIGGVGRRCLRHPGPPSRFDAGKRQSQHGCWSWWGRFDRYMCGSGCGG